MGIRILLAEDEETLRRVISEVLTDEGHEVSAFPSGEEALEAFRAEPFPLVLTDLVMRRVSGIELLRHVKALQPEALVVLLTSHASLDTATEAVRSGAYDYLIKPFEDLDVICNVVRRAENTIALIERNQQLMDQLARHAAEVEALNSRLEELAKVDSLTGLPNHRFFREALTSEIARCQRHGKKFSLLFVDIDRFKECNDNHGHAAGDRVLKALASIFGRQSRRSDAVARYGGEEFVVLAPETGKEGGAAYGERIRKLVEQERFSDPGGAPIGGVTVSVGVATFPDDGVSDSPLIDRADQALYLAKQDGRNRVCAWNRTDLPRGTAAPDGAASASG